MVFIKYQKHSKGLCMQVEFEAKFLVDHDQLRCKLIQIGAHCVRPRQLMRRYVFGVSSSPQELWLRVRDEGEYCTLTLKSFDTLKSDDITSVKELEVKVSNFDNMVGILQVLGYEVVTYVENYREIWQLNDCSFMLDTWPWLHAIVEIEGPNQHVVVENAALLDLKMQDAMYGPNRLIYQKIYQLSEQEIKATTRLTFQEKPTWVRSV